MNAEDRELLELAAKAACRAGMKLERPDDPDGIYVSRDVSINGYAWDPLGDDGDAFRLGVMLSLHVKVCRKIVLVEQRTVGDDMVETLGKDPLSSTRRAIVRAAAEIGKYIT